MLNPNSPLPLYYQLAEIIRQKIKSGEYPESQKIPSENELAGHYAIGRPTVRQAIEKLASEGFLERRKGSGTYVKVPAKEIDLFSLAGTSSAFESKGIPHEVALLVQPSLTHIDSFPDNPYNNRTAYYISRLHSAESIPVLLEEIFLNRELFRGIESFDLEAHSLSGIVREKYYLVPEKVKQTFQIYYTDNLKAETLKTEPGTPLLLVKRHIDFEGSENALYSELYCRTDHFIFSQTIGGLHHA